MNRSKSSYPSIDEMEARIMRNISRLQGYLEVLRSEIEDPGKQGAGIPKESWKEAADDLEIQIREFKMLLEMKNKDQSQ